MAVKKAVKKEEKKEGIGKVSFKEFKYSGKTFEYTGRVFPSREGSGKVKRTWGLTITLNGLIDIKGCKLVETESNVFITYPQYVTGEKGKEEWKSYIYVNKDLNEEIDALVNELMKVVGIAGDAIAKTSEKTDEDIPF